MFRLNLTRGTELYFWDCRPLQDLTRAVVVHLNFRAGSTFPVPVYTVSPGHWVNKVDTRTNR